MATQQQHVAGFSATKLSPFGRRLDAERVCVWWWAGCVCGINMFVFQSEAVLFTVLRMTRIFVAAAHSHYTGGHYTEGGRRGPPCSTPPGGLGSSGGSHEQAFLDHLPLLLQLLEEVVALRGETRGGVAAGARHWQPQLQTRWTWSPRGQISLDEQPLEPLLNS